MLHFHPPNLIQSYVSILNNIQKNWLRVTRKLKFYVLYNMNEIPATSRIDTAHLSGAPEFTPGF
jgi:hypothetical protein